MKNLICTALDKIFTVFIVILFCQLPLFIEQYEMRLSGHVQESALLVKELERNAGVANKTLPEYIQKLLKNDDRDVLLAGQLLQNALARNKDLTYALTRLLNANPFTRPFVFLFHLQGDVVTETYQNFTFGLSLTLETVLYAAIGLLMAVALLQLARHLWKKLRPSG